MNKQLDEFRIAVRHLCDMAALYANEESEATSLECARYIRTYSKFLEGLEAKEGESEEKNQPSE